MKRRRRFPSTTYLFLLFRCAINFYKKTNTSEKWQQCHVCTHTHAHRKLLIASAAHVARCPFARTHTHTLQQLFFRIQENSSYSFIVRVLILINFFRIAYGYFFGFEFSQFQWVKFVIFIDRLLGKQLLHVPCEGTSDFRVARDTNDFGIRGFYSELRKFIDFKSSRTLTDFNHVNVSVLISFGRQSRGEYVIMK